MHAQDITNRGGGSKRQGKDSEPLPGAAPYRTIGGYDASVVYHRLEQATI